MGFPAKFTERRRDAFLKALSACGIIGDAAKKSGITRKTVREHRDEDEDFERRVQDALEDYGDAVEREFQRRAVEGTVKPFFYQGKRVDRGKIREYSDALLLAALKRRKPEYRDRATIDHNVAGGVLVVGGKKKDLEDWIASGERANPIDKP
jgi:hypothetical protein